MLRQSAKTSLGFHPARVDRAQGRGPALRNIYPSSEVPDMLETWTPYILYALIGAAILIAMKLFSVPVRWIFRVALNTVLGFALLFTYNWLGSYAGLGIGLNLGNALVIGVLGVPGFILLLMLKWLFAA